MIRTLSPESKALLEGLRAPARTLTRVLRIGDSPASVLEELAASSEPLVLMHLLPYVFDKRRSVGSAAARAAASILRRVPIGELPWLDERLRERSGWGSNWYAMRPPDLRFLDRFEREAPALHALASCHPNGYVREAALKVLAPIRDGSELPFLLIRLNDWVGPVRELAMRLTLERANPDYARHIVPALPLVDRLQSLHREDHSQTIGVILDVLRRPESRDAVMRGTEADDRRTRRTAFAIAAETNARPSADLLDRALRDVDPFIRLWAARHLAGSLPDTELDRALERLERDTVFLVRREALELRQARRPDSAVATLVRFLCDRSIGIRSYCQYHLRTRFRMDPAEEYRSIIDSGTSRLANALAGLGEVGDSSDTGRFERFLEDSRASIRAAAISALGHLSKDPPFPALLHGLNEASPAVSRAACVALQRVASQAPVGALRQVFQETRYGHARYNALTLLGRANLWDGLPTLIAASADDQEEMRSRGRALLERWLIRSVRASTAPAAGQLRSIKEALNAHGASLDPRQREKLAFIVRTAGGGP